MRPFALFAFAVVLALVGAAIPEHLRDVAVPAVVPPAVAWDNQYDAAVDERSYSQCSGNIYLTGSSGTISNPSPFGYTYYQNYANCQWVIIANPGEVIRFTLTALYLESNWDYLYFFDGSSQVQVFTGSYGPTYYDVYAYSGTMTVYFTSDSIVTDYGFYGTYSILSGGTEYSYNTSTSDSYSYSSPSSTTSSYTETGSVGETCDGHYVITDADGTIQNPIGASYYSGVTYQPNADCEWKIETGVAMTFYFSHFVTEYLVDNVTIIDGGVVVGTFSGSYWQYVYTTSGSVIVRFESNDAIEYSGFKLHWYESTSPSTCNDGSFYSPGSFQIPNPYGYGSQYVAGPGTCSQYVYVSPQTRLNITSWDLAVGHSIVINGVCGNYGSTLTLTNSGTNIVVESCSYSSMTIEFVRTTLGSGTGFNILISQVEEEPVCGSEQYFYSSTGTLSVPASGVYYENNMYCSWYIYPGGPATVSFSRFDTESYYDYVYIYDGSTYLGSWSGSNPGVSLYTSSGEIYVYFYTDGSVTRTGFDLEWVAADTVSPCASTNSLEAYGSGSFSQYNGDAGDTCTTYLYPYNNYYFSYTYVYAYVDTAVEVGGSTYYLTAGQSSYFYPGYGSMTVSTYVTGYSTTYWGGSSSTAFYLSWYSYYSGIYYSSQWNSQWNTYTYTSTPWPGWTNTDSIGSCNYQLSSSAFCSDFAGASCISPSQDESIQMGFDLIQGACSPFSECCGELLSDALCMAADPASRDYGSYGYTYCQDFWDAMSAACADVRCNFDSLDGSLCESSSSDGSCQPLFGETSISESALPTSNCYSPENDVCSGVGSVVPTAHLLVTLVVAVVLTSLL